MSHEGQTVPELAALSLPVQATDKTVVYRAGGNLKRADMSDVRTYMQANLGTAALADLGADAGDVVNADISTLDAAADVADADVVAAWRSGGPLKKITALQIAQYVGQTAVTFVAAGTGALVRTAQNKMRDLIGVKDFLVADGTTVNGSTALNDFDAAAGGRITFGGGGTVKISSDLPAGVRILDGTVLDTRYDPGVTPADDYGVLALGELALQNNTYIPQVHPASGGRLFASGNCIVALGYRALNANTEGRRMVAVGYRSLNSNTSGYYNTGLGSHTLESCTTGYENLAAGVQALQALTTGFGNVALGNAAGITQSTGSRNTTVGSESLLGITNGNDNAALGYRALGAASSAGMSQNVGIGAYAGRLLTGNDNVFIGYRAGQDAAFTTRNTGVGKDALVSLTTGDDNTALGNQAGQNITTQTGTVSVGSYALASATVGAMTAVGFEALRLNTTGIQNTAFGYRALRSMVVGSNNTAFGHDSLFACTGDNNSSFGRAAGASLTSGSNNTLFGQSAGASLTTNDLNTAIGYQALANNTGGQNTAIGPQCHTGTNSYSNTTAIGYQAEPSKNNQVIIGNSSVVETVIRGVLRTNTTYTVAGLPLVADAGAGARAFVTDANATTFAAIVAGGGANGVPVYCDGTNWRIG